MSWIKDIVDPKTRQWEEFYRNRWQHDKAVRSTHGVNCTGGCSWMVYVKNGIVTWEMQALDYPKLEAGLPLYEPRGCARGITYSWYIYSPLRIKYPYIRGVLMDLWHAAKAKHSILSKLGLRLWKTRRNAALIRWRGEREDSAAQIGKNPWSLSQPPYFTRPRNMARTELSVSPQFRLCPC